MVTRLAIALLRLDGDTQPRSALDMEEARGYGARMLAGDKFPPVVVFSDGVDNWPSDGFHRIEGAKSVGIEQIDCDIREGTVEDARWYSYAANQTHGLRRTHDDKQRAVKGGVAASDGGRKREPRNRPVCRR
jgi:hypothetical protein